MRPKAPWPGSRANGRPRPGPCWARPFCAALGYCAAEAAFRQALVLAPDSAEASLGLGYALFNQNRIKAAESVFFELAERPDAPAAVWRALAAARLNLKEAGGAGAALEKALALDPSDAESHALKGLLAYRSCEADRRWRDWTRQNLVDPQARPDLISPIFDSDRLAAALRSITAARQIGSRVRTDELGARLLTASGRPEAALDFLAASPAPDARTWQLMADVCWLLRDESAARLYLRRSLEARCEEVADLRGLGEENTRIAEVAAGQARHRHNPPSATSLVWVHWDAPAHFAQSIASALAASPASPLAVIGDSTNAFDPCHHMPMTRRAASAWEFLERYRHRSENDYVYEAFCLMRWFLLKDWAEVEGAERLLTLDSDVLLFADVETELVPRLGGHDFAFTGVQGPHLALLTQAGLRDLCGFFMHSYEKGIPEIAGQVTDMTLLPRFLAGRPFADLSAIKDGARVDMNIRLAEGFRMAGGVKEIRFEAGRAYATSEASGEAVRLLALHFQGTAKDRMAKALQRQDVTA
ncbi:MAG: hypothetical protein HQL43_05500 [Alphaproteobacteria bacterium]|nr:hypothetical protein [Alphaproteobacteria bacterium]